MPFIIDAGQAARSICDGLERERTEIAFPAPMALLMKTARLVPARVWTALWKSTSLPDTRPARTPRPRPPEAKDTMKLLKTVVVEKPLDAVFGYLSDFTTTTDWDPGTVTTVTPARQRRSRHHLPQHLNISRPDDPADLPSRGTFFFFLYFVCFLIMPYGGSLSASPTPTAVCMEQGRRHRPNWRSFAPRRSSPGWAATPRSGSVRPTWPGTGGPGPATTWPTC